MCDYNAWPYDYSSTGGTDGRSYKYKVVPQPDFNFDGDITENEDKTLFHCPQCGSDDVECFELEEEDELIEKATEISNIVLEMCYTPDRIIFNPPTTIVYWLDSTKTVVKASGGDVFSPEVGFAMALAKKMYGRADFMRMVTSGYWQVPKLEKKKKSGG